MTKRSNGAGSLSQRADGRWMGRVTYVNPATGETNRTAVYGKTQKEARAKLKEVRDRLGQGAPARDAKVTVEAWVEQWVTTALAASDRKGSTKELYAGLARTHLSPAPFGLMTLDRLRPSDVEALLLAKRDDGKASSTVRAIYTVLRTVLDIAVRDGLVAKNVAAQVKRPQVERTEARYLVPNDVRRLLEVVAEDRLRALFVLLLGTALRRGEALALRWDDIDLDGSVLRVRGTLGRVGGVLVITDPKTDKSRRTVPLPPAVVLELRGHKVRQAEERLRAGSEWRDGGLVFPSRFGTPLDPRNALRSLAGAATRAGLTGVGLHTLRHSAASAYIASGVHMKVVQELLGHSSYAITADVYAHVAVSQQQEAAARLSETFGW
ncbi:MAG: integrase family protein [Frankiales bacterium]|nr:integrase family protein [Frankiales bacterium]